MLIILNKAELSFGSTVPDLTDVVSIKETKTKRIVFVSRIGCQLILGSHTHTFAFNLVLSCPLFFDWFAISPTTNLLLPLCHFRSSQVSTVVATNSELCCIALFLPIMHIPWNYALSLVLKIQLVFWVRISILLIAIKLQDISRLIFIFDLDH